MLNYVVIAFLLVLFSCGESPCINCGSTGKISSSEEIDAPFELISDKLVDNGIFTNKYEWVFKVRNKSDKGGDFKIITYFIFDDIGKKEIQKNDYIASGQIVNFKFNFKTKSKPNSFKYKIIPPRIVVSNENICKKCNGKGKI